MIALEWMNFATHVASQLCGVYFAPLVSAPPFEVEFIHGVSFSESSSSDWEELILRDAKSIFPSFFWMHKFLHKTGLSHQSFAEKIAQQIALTKHHGGMILGISNQQYPQLLREISDPPLCLFAVGDPSVLLTPGIAVIGSRKANLFALEESFELGRCLAEASIGTISGGAIGCDIAAHRGVLSSRGVAGKGIAVLAGGADQLYPQSSANVLRGLAGSGGLIVSERLWGAPCLAHDFPIRNRIISGMSEMTTVMQAGENSGAMITAKMSLDQGREVAVLDHPLDDVRARGSHQLIRDGALQIKSHLEILDIVIGGLA